MKEFKIEITELLSKSLVLKADSEEKAIEKAKYLYDNEEITLDSDNYVNTEIKLTTSINDENNKDNLISEIIEYLYKDEKKHFEEFGNEKPSDHIFVKLQKLKSLI